MLQKILQVQPQDYSALHEEIVLEPAIYHDYHYYSRVLGTAGKIILETPQMSKMLPMNIFPKLNPAQLQFFATTHWHTPQQKYEGRKHYLLMTTAVKPQRGEKQLLIQIAMNITSQRTIIKDYQKNLIIVLLLGCIGSAIIGIFVAKKGMKPLYDITESTKRITLVKLTERLNLSSWPQELSLLVAALNGMLDRIETGFVRLSQFSGELAHEFRTPIAILMGEAEVALSKLRTGEEYREVLASSLEELTHLSHMIDALLFLARAENPNITIHRSLTNVGQVLDKMRDFYEVVAEERNIKIICQGDSEVMADEVMLRRAISNLITNSLRHVNASGTITLATQVDGEYTSIVVSDDGQGIPAEHLPLLCNRFYRVTTAKVPNIEGYGLGLAIVKSIMDLHHGRIIITSQVGQGTTVTLSFPKD